MVIYWHRQPNLYFLLHKRIVWQMNFARFFSVYEMRSSSSVIRLSLRSTWNISLFKFKKVNFSIPFRVKLLFPSTPLRHAQAIELYRYNVWGSGCVAQLVERSYIEHTVNCIEKMKIKKKRPRLAHIKKEWYHRKKKRAFTSTTTTRTATTKKTATTATASKLFNPLSNAERENVFSTIVLKNMFLSSCFTIIYDAWSLNYFVRLSQNDL